MKKKLFLMRSYKGLLVPPIHNNAVEMRQVYCDAAAKCTVDDPQCDKCMYSTQNVKEFEEWLNSGQKPKIINL